MLFIWFYRSLNLYFSDYEEKERLVIMERERERERERVSSWIENLSCYLYGSIGV